MSKLGNLRRLGQVEPEIEWKHVVSFELFPAVSQCVLAHIPRAGYFPSSFMPDGSKLWYVAGTETSDLGRPGGPFAS